MPRSRPFKVGDEFPREGFVQAALERGFATCELVEAGYADLACIDESDDDPLAPQGSLLTAEPS